MDLSNLRTVPLSERGGKVDIRQFAQEYNTGSGIRGLLEALPKLLAADSFQYVIGSILTARENNKPIIWGLGGHVIKCGLAPILIQLMKRGFASAFAMNGAASIHDFEIGIIGRTSEDVALHLADGTFGMAEETGRLWNKALDHNAGVGECLGLALSKAANPLFSRQVPAAPGLAQESTNNGSYRSWDRYNTSSSLSEPKCPWRRHI